MKLFYILRGAPGAGKSTLAKQLGGVLGENWFETDQFYMEGGEYRWSPDKQAPAYQWCQQACAEAMKNQDIVICSNVFATSESVELYREVAIANGFTPVCLVVENRHAGQNIHNVPEEAVEGLRNRIKENLSL